MLSSQPGNLERKEVHIGGYSFVSVMEFPNER